MDIVMLNLFNISANKFYDHKNIKYVIIMHVLNMY